MIRFGAPFLLLFGLPLVALVALRLRRLPRSHTGWPRRLIQVALLFASVSVAIAIARPELGRPLDRTAVVFLVDESRSVSRTPGGAPEAMAQVRRAIEGMQSDDRGRRGGVRRGARDLGVSLATPFCRRALVPRSRGTEPTSRRPSGAGLPSFPASTPRGSCS